MIVAPCKDCTFETGRSMTCHDTCEKYKKFRKELDEYNQRERERKAAEYNPYPSRRRRRKW